MAENKQAVMKCQKFVLPSEMALFFLFFCFFKTKMLILSSLIDYTYFLLFRQISRDVKMFLFVFCRLPKPVKGSTKHRFQEEDLTEQQMES